MSGILRVVLVFILVGGCALLEPLKRPVEPPVDTAAPSDAAAPADGAEEAAPEADPVESRLPGMTVASLGDVTQPGLWMRTPLVSVPMRGRVKDPATGASVVLDLLPLDAEPGAGSRMSLAAYQALKLPLTALPELRVEPAG